MKATSQTRAILGRLRLFMADRRLPSRAPGGTKQIAAMQRIFPAGCRYDDAEPVFNHPLICLGFTNRSGSNLLGSYLRDCPPLSGFREDLNTSTIEMHAARLGADTLPQALRLLSEEQCCTGKIYGFKTSAEQVLMLRRFSIERMYRGGIRLIDIRREDIVAQAISYDIALQTGRWTSRIMPPIEVEPVCDPARIERLIVAIRASQTLMDLLVERDAVPRIIICYEDLVAAPAQQLHRIAQFCGFDTVGWSVGRPKIARQADATNLSFRERFRDHVAACLP